MSYHCTLDGNLLTVVSVTYSFDRTEYRYWYTDIEKWLRSVTGRKGEVPTVPMTASEIDWAKRYYLPKVSGNAS